MIPLGDLPGGSFHSFPAALSGNGLVAVGTSSSQPGFGTGEAFSWSTLTGIVGLGTLDGVSIGQGVSPNGRFIVGNTYGTSAGNLGVLWAPDGSVHHIPDIPGGNNVSGTADVSDTGVVVGYSQYATNSIGPLSQAIRWTVDGGLQPLGFLSDTDTNSVAYAISADGSVIAGRSNSGNWLWTEDKGMTFAIGNEFLAQNMTNDGRFLVGVTDEIVNGQYVGVPTIWSAGTGRIDLPIGDVPPSWVSSVVRDASLDAEVLLGMRYALQGGGVPYIWFDQGSTGMVLTDYLLLNGLDFNASGYRINDVAGISDDGTRFLLETFNPDGSREAVLVIVPAPATASIFTLGLIATRRKR